MKRLSQLDKTGGDQFESQRIKVINNNITIVNTEKVVIAKALTGILGLAICIFGIFYFIKGEGLASLGIMAVGATAIYAAIFVKQQNKVVITLNNETNNEKNSIMAKEILEIELIKKYIASANISDTSVDGFECFEVNIRLKDGERIMLLNHGNWEAIQRDVNILHQKLNTPVITN